MSYNISALSVKYLSDFRFDSKVTDRAVAQEPLPEIFEIKGDFIGDELLVSDIFYGGEWSGRWWDTFISLMKKSKGKMMAMVIWEGGDSISFIAVQDGIVHEKDDNSGPIVENTMGHLASSKLLEEK